ncbi:MAG: hypothetical protein IJP48_05315 [Synergistaceae bacterium]|nr:hypothetical protein [Synergistaceae bacterium]
MLITIGAFDGFHRGHEKLLDICRANSDSNNWAVLSFWPHPGEFMKRLNHYLFTLSEREFIRRVLNIPNMFILRFNDELRNLQPERFWTLIHSRFNITGLVMGSDFHFGLDRRGSAESLKLLAESSGVSEENIHIANLLDKGIYSSSNARQKIFSGDVRGVREILGYNFFIMSNIIHGSHRGSKMNLPTANLNLVNNKIIPPYGVYSTAVLVNNQWHCGALSIGNNPTFRDVNETRAEVHILDFDSNNNIYGENMLLFFLDRIRDIKTFDNKDSLINQIEQDINTCMKIYREADIDSQEFFKRAKEVYYSQKNFLPEIINITHGEDIN